MVFITALPIHLSSTGCIPEILRSISAECLNCNVKCQITAAYWKWQKMPDCVISHLGESQCEPKTHFLNKGYGWRFNGELWMRNNSHFQERIIIWTSSLLVCHFGYTVPSNGSLTQLLSSSSLKRLLWRKKTHTHTQKRNKRHLLMRILLQPTPI